MAKTWKGEGYDLHGHLQKTFTKTTLVTWHHCKLSRPPCLNQTPLPTKPRFKKKTLYNNQNTSLNRRKTDCLYQWPGGLVAMTPGRKARAQQRIN